MNIKYNFHILNGITEINHLFHDILILWPTPVYYGNDMIGTEGCVLVAYQCLLLPDTGPGGSLIHHSPQSTPMIWINSADLGRTKIPAAGFSPIQYSPDRKLTALNVILYLLH